MIYLLDTDVFTLAHHGRGKLRDRIDTFRSSNEVAISVVTRIEVLRGRFEAVLKAPDATALLRAQELMGSSDDYLAEFQLLLFDSTAATEFDRVLKSKKLKKIGRADLLIACIALANNATLVTRNTKDFANIPGLKLDNWAD